MTLRLLVSAFFMATVALPGGEAPAVGKAFKTPEAAWKAFVEAAGSGEWTAVEAVLGPAAAVVPPPARAQAPLKKLAGDLGEKQMVVDLKGDQAAFMVEGRAFPVGVRKTDQGWVFAVDSKGREEHEAVLKGLRCLNQLKLVGLCCLAYELKNGKPAESLEALLKVADLEPALKPSEVLCPQVAEGSHRKGLKGVPCDYLYIPVKSTAAKDGILAFCPKGNHPGGLRHCVFVDGRADKVEDEAKFRAALRSTLTAAGIPVGSSKGEEQTAAAGSLPADPAWRKAIRTELGLEGPAGGASEGSGTQKKQSSSTKPASKKAKKGAEGPPAPKEQPK